MTVLRRQRYLCRCSGRCRVAVLAVPGRNSVGNYLSNFCTWGGSLAAATVVFILQAVIKEAVLTMEKVPEVLQPPVEPL
jgi:hypothetical protein